MAIDYKSSGVDIEKGDAFVDWLQEDKSQTPHADKVLGGIGGFASLFHLNFPEIKDPCLVSATDGIGTKLKLAIDLKKYDTLGQDLVAMCANDLICTGAQPLFFLDYYATSHLNMEQAKPFLAGVRKACRDSQMALIGGETAEMPGLYQKNDFDCAGFAVGLVDRSKVLGADRVEEGMTAVGVSSSGFHSNGFSLIRKLFSSEEDLEIWGERLLEPTTLYVNLVLDCLKSFSIASVAHITGGGIHNIPRVLPEGLGLELKEWAWPELFTEAQKRGELSDAEMLKTFNCGVGLVMIMPADQQGEVLEQIQSHGLQAFDLGVIRSSSEPLIFPKGE